MQLNFICPTNREIESKGVYYYMTSYTKSLFRAPVPQSVLAAYKNFAMTVFLDLPIPEPYFYYIAMHWPNEDQDKHTNIEYLPTYDEETLSR